MGDPAEIARALDQIATLLRLSGESPYRARAYERGARAVESLGPELDRLVAEERLTSVPGIGAALATHIAELHRTGRSEMLERLRAAMPPGAPELGRVISPKRIAAVHEVLGVRTIDELEAAARARRLRTVRGFGPKTEADVIRRIERYRERGERALLVHALADAESIAAHLRRSPGIAGADVAGSVRRWKETTSCIRLVVRAPSIDVVLAAMRKYPRLLDVRLRDDGAATARLPSALPVRAIAVTPADHARALIVQTGSRAHVARLEGLAGGALPPGRTEEHVYRALGMQWVPPELREDAGEIEAALAGELPQDLVRVEDVRGAVHCHTTYSDGRDTVEAMARAARDVGLGYITITDHSPSAWYAGGVLRDRLPEQWGEIARAEADVGIRVFRGTESDILAEGALDYPDDVLAQLDVVIASIHARMKMRGAQMTDRLVTAMRHPVFKIWGHALGRLVMRRDPIDCDVDRVIDAVAESRAAIEINGDPHRLDLEPKHVREARRRGVRAFVLSTDAHATDELDNLRFAVAMARRGGVRRGEVLNAAEADEFRRAVRPR